MSRVIFMGTPDFAVPCVEVLAGHSACELVAVVCQPDKIHGRHKTPQPPPVKTAALNAGVPVFQPRKLKSGPFPEELAALAPDLIVVAAYGRILPPSLLELPPLGCVNVHASLLPRWRGAAPIQWSIASGDPQTGVCLMAMDEGLDTGAVYACAETAISRNDTGQSVHDRLSTLGSTLLRDQLPALLKGELKAEPQDDSLATHARMLTRADGRLDWQKDANALMNQIQGFYPWPGAFTTFSATGKLLKLFPQAEITEETGPPGSVLAANENGLTVACGRNAITVNMIQVEGRRRLPVAEVIRGFGIQPGDMLL